MTNSRRVVVGIAGAATALALVVIGPAETALGARFPFGGGLGGGGRGQHDGQDGKDGLDGRGANNPRGAQGQQGDEGEGGRDVDGADGKNGDQVDRTLTPQQRARQQAREAIARAREHAANAR